MKKLVVLFLFLVLLCGCADKNDGTSRHGPDSVNLYDYNSAGGGASFVLYTDPTLTSQQRYEASQAISEQDTRFYNGFSIVYLGPEIDTLDYNITGVPYQVLVSRGASIFISGQGYNPGFSNFTVPVIVCNGRVSGAVPMGPGGNTLGAVVKAKRPWQPDVDAILVSVDDGSGLNAVPALYKMLHYYYNQVLVDRMPKDQLGWYTRWANINAMQWDINEAIRSSR